MAARAPRKKSAAAPSPASARGQAEAAKPPGRRLTESSKKNFERNRRAPSEGRAPSARALAITSPRLRILVLSGPNLDRLGRREPEIYGRTTLAEVHAVLAERARNRAEVVCRQSNYEGALIDWIGPAKDQGFSGILINPGALTHTSYALYDALKGAGIPAVEVHLSNPEAREPFRHCSRVAAACLGKVAGFGARSYSLALDALLDRLFESQ